MAKYYVPARGQGTGDTLEGTGAVPGRGGTPQGPDSQHGTANWSEDRL
jgi:hypothetical protein